jgi:hypothetical protein
MCVLQIVCNDYETIWSLIAIEREAVNAGQFSDKFTIIFSEKRIEVDKKKKKQ